MQSEKPKQPSTDPIPRVNWKYRSHSDLVKRVYELENQLRDLLKNK